jgi:hypothetical protein
MRKPTERELFATLALGAILPIGILSVVSFANDARDLSNPCFTWGAGNPASVTVSSGGPCTSAGATSETITQMLIRNGLVQGGILFGGALGVLGALRGRLNLLAVGSGLLFLESAPLVLGGTFVLTMMPATFLAWRAMVERRSGRPVEASIRSDEFAPTAS